MMMEYLSLNDLEFEDYDISNRTSQKKLLKDCTLKPHRRDEKCNPSECAYCGWNPREQVRRKENGKLHKHCNGLWGF